MIEEKVDIGAKVDELYGQGEPSTLVEKSVEAEGAEAATEKAEKPEAETVTPEEKVIQEKLAKISELLGDDEKAIEAYIKKHGYHTDPAWKRQRELIEKYKSKPSALTDEQKALIERVEKITSSPTFIRSEMKEAGYKDEAINAKLRELGHKVEEGTVDDFTHVLKALNIDVSQLDDNGKNYVNTYMADVVKVASLLIDKKLGERLPGEIKPLQEGLTSITRERTANQYAEKMEGLVKAEGVLDFEKDIEPQLREFMKENPSAKQEDVYDYFEEINHTLVIERLKTGNRKVERDEKKIEQRPSKAGGHTIDISKIKPVTATTHQEASKEISRLIDELGIE